MSDAGDGLGARTALVTGASAGIGAAISRALAERGCRLALGARRLDKLEAFGAELRSSGATVFTHRLDVCDHESVARFFAASEAELGVADVVVNNAGVSRPGLLHELEAEWLATEVATNLLGPMLVSRRALAALRSLDAPGDLVFVGSDAAVNPRPGQAAYSATKAGLENLVRTLALELEGSGVRPTLLRVGPTITEFGSSWDPTVIADTVAYWQSFGLQRHLDAVLDPGVVARAVVDAVSLPRSAHWPVIEVQPAIPRR